MSFKMKSICIFVIITTVYAFEESLETIVTEKEDALLTFRFTSESPVPFSLCVGQRDPFYADGQLILDNLTPSQQKRFRVQAWHSRIQQYTLVQIVIEKVQRTDSGSFTSRFYGTETLPPGTKEIALTVYFPPGRAQCWSMPTETEGWDEIQCAAKGGSPPGTIMCQAFNKAEVPLALTHLQNATHVFNRFLLSHGTSVHCCAKNYINHNDLTCSDFVLERDGTLIVEISSTMPSSYENETGLDISQSLNTEVPITTESQTQVLNSTKVILIITIPIFIAILLIGIVIHFILRSNRLKKQKEVYSKVDTNLPETIPNEARASGLDSRLAVDSKGNGDKNNEQSLTDDTKDKSKENEEDRRHEKEQTSENQPSQGCSQKLPETQANTQNSKR